MGGPYVGNAATFLVETIFGLYILVVMLRFLLQLVRADFYNPVSQFIVKATQPPLTPLRRVIPGIAGIDVASVVLLLALKSIELWIVIGLSGHGSAAPAGILMLSMAELTRLALNVFLFSILIQVIISWVNPGLYNPVTSLLHTLNEPLLGPARRAIPPISGLDLSPLVVLIALQLASMLVVAPLRDVAVQML
jgi:YggT family protein